MTSAPARSLAIAALALATLLLGACATAPPAPELGEIPSAEVLYEEGNEILASPRKFLGVDVTDYATAIGKYQDIIDNYPYSDLRVDAELRIADAFYVQEEWEEALSYYLDFVDLHPEHEKVPTALMQAARSHAQQSGDHERDQSHTKQALEILDRVIARYPYAPEATDAEAMWKELRQKVGRHVMGIGDFYLDREEFQSAANRYRTVLNEYPGLGLDADALYKLGVCYQNMNLEDEAQRIFEVILDNYEGSEVAEAAQDLIPAAN